MATLLETASLVMVPSGYEDGTLGSLVPTDASGDFAFTRGSNLSATRVNEQGLIEKGYENLLLQSNNFDISPWTQLGVDTPISGQSGYDGTNDAWKVNSNANISNIRQTRNQTGLITLSVYAKKGEYDYVGLYFSGDAVGVIFSLIDGGVESPIAAYPDVYTNGENIGNGWYRFSITHNSSSTGIAGIYVCETTSYFGNTTTGEGIYIQDAQLNQGLAAYPYIETTAAPEKGGILADLPRVDYSSGRASLLLEPQRSNVLQHSEYLSSPTFTISNILVNYNSASSPEGKTNAAKLIVTPGGGNTRLFKQTSGSGSQVVSVFAKAGEKNAISVSSYTGTAYLYAMYNLANGTLINSNADNTGIEDIGDGWYRVWVYVANSTNRYAHLSIGDSTNSPAYTLSATGNGSDGLYAYGFQAEQDATYPTSYIPTYGTSQTRLADDAFNANTIDADNDFTMIIESKGITRTNSSLFFSGIGYLNINLNGALRFRYNSANHSTSGDYTQTFKWLLRKDSTSMKIYLNGILTHTITTGIASGSYDISLEGGMTTNFMIFSTALSDDECIELTTL